MQLNPVYLYPNKVDVFTNLGTWTTERYRKVYQRNFKVFRGVDNRLDLQVRNSDEKMKDITGYTLVFNLIERETQKLILQKDCTIVSAVNGKVFVTLTESELNIIESGMYNYTIISINDSGVKAPLYCDSQFGVIGTIEVHGDVFGTVLESQVIDTFSIVPAYWPNDGKSRSELQYASPAVHSVRSTHTFVFYDTDYKGTVTIQGSLDEGGTPQHWVDIQTITYPITQQYLNVTGKWKWFRVLAIPTVARLDVTNLINNTYSARVTNGGQGYSVGDQFTVIGTKLNGIAGINDLVFTVTDVKNNGVITGIAVAGVSAYYLATQATTISLGSLDKIVYR